MVGTEVLVTSQELDRAREQGTKEMSGGATARGAMEKGGCVMVIERGGGQRRLPS